MTLSNPSAFFPDDPSNNEETLWRMIMGVRASMLGAGGPLAGWPPSGISPGQALIVGPNYQLSTDPGCNVFFDILNHRVGINTCFPAYTLDVISNECGSNVVAWRGGTSNVDQDHFPLMSSTPLTRIRSSALFSATLALNGGQLSLLTADLAGVLKNRIQLDNLGNIVTGTAALSTTATDGFLYVETCAGTPTGVPTAFAGVVPLVWDTTNNKLYFYNSGWTTTSGTVGDSPNGASGQVSFFTAAHTITGDNKLFWDNTNKRLGIGNNAPRADLDIGTGTAQTDCVINSLASTFSGYRIDRASTEKWFMGMTNSGNEEFVIRRSATANSILIDTSGNVFLLDGHTLIGDTASSGTLTIKSTSAATKGDLILDAGDLAFTSTMRSRMSGQNRFRHLNSMAMITLGSDQSLSNSTITKIQFDTSELDTDSVADLANNQLKVKINGKYLVFSFLRFDTSAVGQRSVILTAGGKTHQGDFPNAGAGVASSFVGFLVSLTANDTISASGFQNSGGNLNVRADGGASFLGAIYLGE